MGHGAARRPRLVLCMRLLYHSFPRLTVDMSRNSPLSSVQHAIQQLEQMNVLETLGTAADLASTVGELTAVVAVILQDAPYVQSIAGVLTQIIKIRDVTPILS